jgi:hypothetical protein
VQKEIDAAGDIEKLIAQIEKVKKEKLEAEGASANQTQRIASAKSEFENVVAQTAKLRDTEARGRKRRVVALEVAVAAGTAARAVQKDDGLALAHVVVMDALAAANVGEMAHGDGAGVGELVHRGGSK